jgi:hypothetical protein
MKPHVLWKRFERNETGRDFAVGDTHGHFPALERLLARVEFDDARDRLFAVGAADSKAGGMHDANYSVRATMSIVPGA